MCGRSRLCPILNAAAANSFTMVGLQVGLYPVMFTSVCWRYIVVRFIIKDSLHIQNIFRRNIQTSLVCFSVVHYHLHRSTPKTCLILNLMKPIYICLNNIR